MSLVGLIILCVLVSAGSVFGQSLTNIDAGRWQQYYNENQRVIVLFTKESNCDKCQLSLDAVHSIAGQPEIPADVELGQSSDTTLASKLGVTQFPALVFLREKSHVIYDGEYGVEELIEWVQLASTTATKLLNDDSFEHLTQASTGATTGDWLVAFYTDSCRKVLKLMETLGVRIRRHTNVAKVNTAENKVLAERFRITGCPEVILFKQGRMYRYDLPKIDLPTLTSFVDGFYKNSKAEIVPGQKSSFDHLTESIADYIKTQLDGENRTLALAAIAGVTVGFLLVILCCCRSLVGPEIKQKEE